MLNVPNCLTGSRLVLGPLFLLLFVAPLGWGGRLACVAIAGLIELSDLFDGMLARKRGEVTDFGRFLDPFADSLSRLSIFLAFLATGYAAVWMFAVILYRDLLVAYVRIWAMRHGVVQAARLSGKLKAVVQGVAILVISLGALAAALTWLDATLWRSVARWTMAGVAVVTGLSGVDYVLGLRRIQTK